MEDRQGKTGVWIIGAFGSLATTAVVGARAIVHGLCTPIGLMSEDPAFKDLGLIPLSELVFGGHEIRADTIAAAASRISRENGSIHAAWTTELQDELDLISGCVRPGIALGGGAAIESLRGEFDPPTDRTLRDCVDRLASDIRQFKKTLNVHRLVVINLASTEPPSSGGGLTRAEDLNRVLDSEAPGSLRPSTLYAYAAMQAGAAFVNFTASGSCLCPAIEETARARRLPYMGSDGKTGETLVKSGLAPMFRIRRLEVMSWVGYNVLGNCDGRVLAAEENKQSKQGSKDAVVPGILGYPLRTHVGIDYVPSLGDSKVAWDFIHFRGFLGHPMSMQFVWQGCDSILAAPLVLDLVRFADLALQRGEVGPMTHLSSYFKNPIHHVEHDLHRQFDQLLNYAQSSSQRRV